MGHMSGGGTPGPGRARDADDLLVAVARHQTGAFDQLWRALLPVVIEAIRAVLHDSAQVEEVAQEVMAEVWQSASRYEPVRGSARTWAATIARRRAVDRIRSGAARSAREARALAPAAAWDQVNEAVEGAFERNRLRCCLSRLNPVQREAISLVFYAGCSHAQVAERTGVPLGTAKSRIRGGLARLRACMAEEDHDEAACSWCSQALQPARSDQDA
jgi:RNA polymerase sigma-70 factor, ECF subfamily